MLHSVVTLFVLCCYFVSAESATNTKPPLSSSLSLPQVTTFIRGSLHLPNDVYTLNTTKLTLNGGEYTTYTNSHDGSFIFHNVGPGVHLLDVHNPYHLFSQVKIQLLERIMIDNINTNDAPDRDSIPKCIEYAYPGATKRSIQHPLKLTAHASFDYFEPRPKFNIFYMLKNPMVLMMIFSAVFMFFMPKMMENLDEEQKEQMQKQMEMQSDPSKMLSQLWGDISGANNEEEEKQQQQQQQQQQQIATGSRKRGGGGGGGGRSNRRSKRD